MNIDYESSKKVSATRPYGIVVHLMIVMVFAFSSSHPRANQFLYGRLIDVSFQQLILFISFTVGLAAWFIVPTRLLVKGSKVLRHLTLSISSGFAGAALMWIAYNLFA